jgi:hypothetical protein
MPWMSSGEDRAYVLRPPAFRLDVIPAKAGIHPAGDEVLARWIPAFAGMTTLAAI